MGRLRFARKLVALAAAMAILLAVPAAAAPSFTVFAEEEVQETETSKPKETVKETKQVKETKASSKVAETTKTTESQKPAETKPAETKPAETKPVETKPAETTKATEASKPSETVKETEATKPAETVKETEPAETTKSTEPEETKPSEEIPAETTEPSETKTSEPSETAEPAETTVGGEETEPSETAITEETQKPAVARRKAKGEYKGINIDGNFSDWDSVVKHDFTVGANSHVNAGAMVWDGDWIYLYIDEVQQNSAAWSGKDNGGNFAITTDTNKTLVINMKDNGKKGNKITVENPYNGKTLTVENGGIKVAFNSDYATWGAPTLTEIAIPTSALPDYISKISFGFYQDDPIISNVANLHPNQVTTSPDDPHEENDGSKIKIDGDYRDWTDYPHQIFHYDKSAPGHNFPDAEGAIYQKNSKTVYVHAYTNDFKLDYYDGNEFLEIRLERGGQTTTAMCCLIDDNGNILDWNSKDKHFAPGTYRFAILDTKCWRTTTNINHLGEGDVLYGIQYLTVSDPVDETEFYINTETLARYLGVSGGELKVTFHRVGKQPLIASGVSSGPVFTIALTSVAAGSYYVFTRRKRRQA